MLLFTFESDNKSSVATPNELPTIFRRVLLFVLKMGINTTASEHVFTLNIFMN
jgi:hypothetical protein